MVDAAVHRLYTALRKPDICHKHLAGILTCRIQYKPQLIDPERNREVGPNGCIHNGSRRPVNPRGDIERINRSAAGIDIVYNFFINSLYIAGQSDTEYAVNDNVKILFTDGRQRQYRHLTCDRNLQLFSRLLCHPLGLADDRNRRPVSHFM